MNHETDPLGINTALTAPPAGEERGEKAATGMQSLPAIAFLSSSSRATIIRRGQGEKAMEEECWVFLLRLPSAMGSAVPWKSDRGQHSLFASASRRNVWTLR